MPVMIKNNVTINAKAIDKRFTLAPPAATVVDTYSRAVPCAAGFGDILFMMNRTSLCTNARNNRADESTRDAVFEWRHHVNLLQIRAYGAGRIYHGVGLAHVWLAQGVSHKAVCDLALGARTGGIAV